MFLSKPMPDIEEISWQIGTEVIQIMQPGDVSYWVFFIQIIQELASRSRSVDQLFGCLVGWSAHWSAHPPSVSSSVS